MRSTDHHTEGLDRRSERALMRLLHGELPAPEARIWQRRIAEDPGLAAAYRRMEDLWGSLHGPPEPTHGTDLTALVSARLRSEVSSGSVAAPLWARLVAAAALLAGVFLGVGLERWSKPWSEVESAAPVLTLAEDYWGRMEEAEEEGP